MSIFIANLAFYDFPEIRQTNEVFWSFLRDFIQEKWSGKNLARSLPKTLQQEIPLDQLWTSPNHFFSQCCGYDLAVQYPKHLSLIASPCYSHLGCEGARHRSFIVVSKKSKIQSILDLQNQVAAVNSSTSNSGMNLFRKSISDAFPEFDSKKEFFRQVVLTGSHYQSLIAVKEEQADVACIDCVTFGILSKIQPELTRAVKIIHQTPLVPTPPFVTHAQASSEQVKTLRETLNSVFSQDREISKKLKQDLGLVGIETLERNAYSVIQEFKNTSTLKRFSHELP